MESVSPILSIFFFCSLSYLFFFAEFFQFSLCLCSYFKNQTNRSPDVCCCILVSFYSKTAIRAKAIAAMEVAVVVILCATVISAINVIKWDTLRGNAKKLTIDATDAMVNMNNEYVFMIDLCNINFVDANRHHPTNSLVH